MANPNQFKLLSQRRFLPYFVLQFLGALNDNLYKTSLLMLIAITFATKQPQKANFLNNFGAAAFIVPFFLFAATAGQLADKFEKRKLIHYIKFAEVLIALSIGFGFYFGHFWFLLGILFLLGTQSAFFSPVKYSILPQYLSRDELMGGNGLVESGTFVAILLGTIFGGIMMSDKALGTTYIFISVLVFALIGWVFSWFVPPANSGAQNPELAINWDPISQTLETLKAAFKERTLFLSMLGISWFWFYGSILLTQIPNYAQIYLGGTPSIMAILLISASLGIGAGSLLCESLSKSLEELGLVPFGAIGLTLFLADLSFAHAALPTGVTSVVHFINSWPHCRIMLDLFLIGLFGGFYSVPLYVLLQNRSTPEKRSQIIAANNILNALFMTAASAIAIMLLRIGISIPQLFLVVSLMSALATLLLFYHAPEFLERFKIWGRSFFPSKPS